MTILTATHPETIRQVLRRSFRLYRRVFFHVFLLSVLLSITVFIPRILTLIIGENIFLNMPILDPHRLWLSLITVVIFLFFGAILWRVYCFTRQAHDSLRDDMNIAFHKIFYIFIAAVLQSFLFAIVIYFVGVIVFNIVLYPHFHFNSLSNTEITLLTLLFIFQCCLITYILFATYFYLPTIVIENKGIISSFAKSVTLVWGNWWRTFITQMTPWLFYVLMLMIVRDFFKINVQIYFVESADPPSLTITLIHILVFAIFVPFVATTAIVQLRDLELRKKLGKNI